MNTMTNNKKYNKFFHDEGNKISLKLYEMMDREGILKFFQLIPRTVAELNGVSINEYPIIILHNDSSPKIGVETLYWMDKLKTWKISYKMEKNGNEIAKLMGDDGSNAVNVLGYVESEMKGFSDWYTYKEDNDELIPKLFSKPADTDDNIITPPIDNKLSARDQELKIRNISNNRREQDLKIKEAFEQFRKRKN